jgi:hypothetical protein
MFQKPKPASKNLASEREILYSRVMQDQGVIADLNEKGAQFREGFMAKSQAATKPMEKVEDIRDCRVHKEGSRQLRRLYTQAPQVTLKPAGVLRW